MSTSRLPTGTVREEGRGNRTFPKQSTSHREQSPGGRPHHRPNQPTDQSAGSRATELQALREEYRQAQAEIQRLESQVDHLQKQVTTHKQAKQSIIDRYEQIISELESAAATAPQSTPNGGGANRNSIAEQLKRWLL